MTLFSKGHKMNQEQNKAIEAIKAPIQREWLNPKEAHQEFGFSVSTLAKWRMKNIHLKFSKMGKYIKYKRSDIETFLNSNIVEVA